MEETPRERAISSEPRRNPFEDNEQTSRKRQRVSRGSRSRSTETAGDSDNISDSMVLQTDEPKADADAEVPPSTPIHAQSESSSPEPTSSRVTINLRTRHLDPIPSSPSPPETPSKMPDTEDAGTRTSIESESDALSAVPAIETPTSSPSVAESPRVEVVTIDDDDDDFVEREAQVAILDDDSLFADPLSRFPYWSEGETLVNTITRVARFLQYDAVENDEAFCKIRDWISDYLVAVKDLDTFHDIFVKNRDFWMNIPELIWALNSRSRFFGEFLKRENDGRQALSDMLCQFGRLAGKFVAMDVKALANFEQNLNKDREPNLGSRPFLTAFSFLVRKEEGAHIGRNLETHYQWDWEEDAARISENFQAEGGTVNNLTKLIEGQVPLMHQNPKIIETFTEPCKLASKIIGDIAYLDRKKDPHGLQRVNVPVRDQEKIRHGYRFFKAMSAALDTTIEKHVTLLTPDAAASHLSCLTSILRDCVYFECDPVQSIVDKYRVDNPTISRKSFPSIICMEWKFGVLKKLITSAQMQLRVVGVSTMCTDLLDIFTKYKGLEPSQSPLLLYFANFVIRNQLIDYLVGIGSHPEIINESNNILGFLIVTKTYTSEQTDKIWQTVTKSQDPRVVEAILRMMMRCLNLFDHPSLLYLCQKTTDLPIESFTLVMREFCQLLFKELVGKTINDGLRYVDGPPYELCVRLIRESSVITGDSGGLPEIQNFAAARFKELIVHGPTMEVRNDVYSSCLVDISTKSNTAPGSICIINTLIRQNLADLRILTTEHALTKLIVEELESNIKSERHSPHLATRNTPANLARRELLLSIIIHEPSSITPELGQRLWDILVGSGSRTMIERNQAWHILNNAVKKSPDNVFLATCFEDYLPHLPPHCYTAGALEFAKEAIISWLRSIGPDSPEAEQSFNSPSLEQLWGMILTAPQNTIDAAAINILVEVYIDSEPILSMPRAKARIIHLALLDRCLSQLKGAAATLKTFNDGSSSESEEGMVIVPSDEQFQEQERIFARSLAVLREFLRAYQGKPQFAPPKPKTHIVSVAGAVQGEPLALKYQSFDGDKHTDIQILTLGSLNTATSLFAAIQKATGFKRYRVYCGGRILDLDNLDAGASLEDIKINALLLVQRTDDDAESLSNGNNTTLELEIAKHFDELWSYLSMHEKVAQEIYYFLVKFPVYEQLIKSFNSTTPHSEIFPLGQPYKSLYAVHSLREYIANQSQKNGAVDEKSLSRAISLTVAAISDRNVLDHFPNEDLKDYLATKLVDSFVVYLKEPLLPAAVANNLNEILLERLLQLLYNAKGLETSQNSVHLACKSMEAILEACVHNPVFWRAFNQHLNTSTLLKDLLLDDPRPLVRKSITKQIIQRCTFSPSLSQVSTTNFVVEFWPMLARLIADAINQPQQCEETFYVAEILFKRLAETSLDSLSLDLLVKEWGGYLLNHSCTENVGDPDSIDLVVKGLGTLLYCATSFAKASQKPLLCGKLGTLLFRRLLFPELSVDEEDGNAIAANVPILHPLSRSTLSDTVFQLVKDDEIQYKAMLTELSALVPHSALEDPAYVYELGFSFERAKSIRSSSGYVGLRNLSNTCYLNSLFTQLFMNVSFREFMLNTHLADGGASQKLLSETQQLFSYMQNSLRRFVDPQNLAGSIRTYEETPIDVTIQMDVDEFYNLLFDRWEGQILAPEAKRKFKSFYGGQLVQQVKSKECPHISERLEPFSAIQCDIKGKSCLQESLQAYVDGEIMEGDNKYKCSTCDKHVDAVKRACLKDIPDNLIFHLKRFDFNLRTLQRSKINDHFSFPTKIDMRPYKIEHLAGSPDENVEDVFELVGVLVHSGTAESGHYYSFIRERPSNVEKQSWVEFNDDTVLPWDPAQMENACFGGPDFRSSIDGQPYDKVWSAYMLFYQRSSVLADQKNALQVQGMESPVRLPVPTRLANHIAMENELLMRKYCLYDLSHANFVVKMLANMKQVNGGRCSQLHNVEKLALNCTLNHLDQVIARTKDLPEFANAMMAIKQVCHACAECSRDYLEWYCDCPEALRMLLLKNPDASVRNDIAASIIEALKKVKAEASYAYGLAEDDDSVDELEGGDPQVIQRIIRALLKLWDIFHANTKAWLEYFGLLSSIASLGTREATLLLDAGFLRKTLEVVSADHLLPLGQQYYRMLTIISKRITTRPVSYDAVIELLCKLLTTCSDTIESIDDDDTRFDPAATDSEIPLTITERHLLMQHWTRSQAHILTEKLLQINQNWPATRVILIELLRWPESLDIYISQAIMTGVRRSPTSLPAAPFLRGALIYCEYSEAPKAFTSMVSHIAKVTSQLDNSDGAEFLQFFKEAHKLAPKDCGMEPQEMFKVYLELVPIWAPHLLTYNDLNVRADTEDFLSDLILHHGKDVTFGSTDENHERATWIVKTAQRLGIVCLEFLHEKYVRPRHQGVRSTLLNIQTVIEGCSDFFEEDGRDVMAIRFSELLHSVLPALKKYTVEEADEDVSDWEGSDGEYDGSSEPMDSIAELCGTADDDTAL